MSDATSGLTSDATRPAEPAGAGHRARTGAPSGAPLDRSRRNPFTRLLERWAGAEGRAPDGVAEFVERWDELEALVIEIYRRGEALDTERVAFERLAAWLGRQYPDLSDHLAPYWRGTAGPQDGGPAAPDPFRSLFEDRGAESFAGDREALRTLPVAREAVNRWLIALAGPPARGLPDDA